MPKSSVGLMAKALAVFSKDMRLELRTRSALNAILMFGVTTLTVVSFALGAVDLTPKILGALFWVIMFFSAMSGLAQGFVREEETGTALALKLCADPAAVFWGKLWFNMMLLAMLSVIITPMFFMFMHAPLEKLGLFLLVEFLGMIALCSATTITAAIIAKAMVKGALFAVISFPLLISLLMVLVLGTEKVFDGATLSEIGFVLQFLVAYIVMMLVASSLLFRFVWGE